MLFWIFVFLLTRQSGLTQGHPNLLARAPTEASCDCTINSCRTLFDIVWGCLATIFACTWVALHQNVPGPDLGWFSLLMRKLRMMLMTIIAPEVIFVTQCLARASQHLPLTELEVATLAFAVLSVVIRLLWLHKPLDVQQPIVVARSEVDIDPLQEEDITPPNHSITLIDKISNGILGNYDYYHPISSTSVPSLYFIEIDTTDTNQLVELAGIWGVGSIFGSIHCAAWNALFPSMAEMWIWRISSVFIAAYPVLTVLFAVITPDDGIATAVLVGFMLFGFVVYPLFRLFLIILSFTTLRSLPPSAFVDVNWSNYIPHL
ncbi:hypothetical protein B0H16DRAFT_1779806 [Mycena metata]|uniref:Transmembrane protein n=1 Tax=Mycena metata TaxID=1033252 RepID=A0AAD7HS48_9AGAR|nr:hypothetical protein B0H16DRAFT_1779806 [Mycena metata]